MRLDHWDDVKLARAVCGLGEDATWDEIERVLIKKLGVDADQFTEVANALIPFTIPSLGRNNMMFYGYYVDGDFIAYARVRNETST